MATISWSSIQNTNNWNKTNRAKHQLLINKRGSTGLKLLNDSKAFIDYSNDMDDIYKNPNKKPKISIAFDDSIVDMLSKRNLIQY